MRIISPAFRFRIFILMLRVIIIAMGVHLHSSQLDPFAKINDRQLARLLDHTRGQIGRLADSILDGEIGVRPVRLGEWTPCRWCPYGAVCRIEPLMGNVRELAKLTRVEVLDGLAASGRGVGDG